MEDQQGRPTPETVKLRARQLGHAFSDERAREFAEALPYIARMAKRVRWSFAHADEPARVFLPKSPE